MKTATSITLYGHLSRHLLPYYYAPIRNYKVDNSKLGRSIEPDGLAEGLDVNSNCLLTIECKYCKTPFSVAMLGA